MDKAWAPVGGLNELSQAMAEPFGLHEKAGTPALRSCFGDRRSSENEGI